MTLSIRLFRWVAALLFLYGGVAQAQTPVRISNVTPTSLCAGQTIVVSFTTASGAAPALYLNGPNTTLQLSTTAVNANTLSATVPADRSSGTYVVRAFDLNNGTSATTTGFAVVALPSAPTTTNISYCQNAPVQSLTATGQNLRWYTAASGGPASTTITPSASTTGSTTYYVSQTNANGCESSRTPLTVTINATPPAPAVANTSVAYCQNTTAQPLQATATSGNTLNWYNSQGTALGSTAPTPQTSNPGTTFYQVSQRSASNCESPRVQITVTINAAPAAPATSPVNVCQGGATVSLVNSVTAAGTLKWYTSPTSASLAAAPQVSTSQTGSQVFYVSQTNANGCESSRAAITYTVYALPNPPSVVSPVTYCQNAVAQPLQATPSQGGTLNFYTVSSGGTSTTSLTPQTQSSNIYYVSQTVNGCESSSRAAITVTINAQPPRPAVTTPVTYCQFATASPLSATASTNNTLVWYALNGQQLGGAPTPPTTVTGVTSYSVSQRDPLSCISQPAIITVTINAKPTAPVTAPLSACLNTPAPSLPTSVTATGALRWYTAASGGVGATVAPVLSTTTATTYTYYVSQVSAEGCETH